MDTNKMRDLKVLAETCLQHQPLRFMRSHGALYIRNDNGIVFDVHQNRSFPDLVAQNKDYADFALACAPSTILTLIAEIERLQSAKGDPVGSFDKHMECMQENIQLKAENEALRAAALAAREFIMHEAEVRGLLDEAGQVSHRHPRRQAAISIIDTAMAKEASHDR